MHLLLPGKGFQAVSAIHKNKQQRGPCLFGSNSVFQGSESFEGIGDDSDVKESLDVLKCLLF